MRQSQEADVAQTSRGQLFVCGYPDCGRSFKTKFSCNRHFLTHTKERQHACEFCGKKFTLAQHLKEHLYRHSRLKPYVCGVVGCQESFRHASELSLHRRTHPEYKLRVYHYTNRPKEELSKELRVVEIPSKKPLERISPKIEETPDDQDVSLPKRGKYSVEPLSLQHPPSSPAHRKEENKNTRETMDNKTIDEMCGMDSHFLEYLMALTTSKLPATRPVLPLPNCCCLPKHGVHTN